MSRLIRIRAPSRLHFGLWSLHDAQGREFGGVGAMIEKPETSLQVSPSDVFEAIGPHCERVAAWAATWSAFHSLSLPPCQIEVLATPPEHAGLGMGTQLGLSVAAGLNAYCGLPSQSPRELALSVGRGRRSAVGTYGFVYGGMIVEQGKAAADPISPLDCRIDVPDDWRFVLLRPRGLCGVAGDAETDAFRTLPAVPPAVTNELVCEVRERLVPAAATADFDTFADSLFRYGNLAGQCFAALQGGPYNGPILAALIERIRQLGYRGVGQSSWGPTLFAVVESPDAAGELVQRVRAADWPGAFGDLVVDIAPPCNRGARIEVCEPADSIPTTV